MGAPLLHGHTRYGGAKRMSPTYISWVCMKRRCTQEDGRHWEDYGGRGITYALDWEDFQSFLSDMGGRLAGTTLDRINSDDHYYKENCRWATTTQQLRNRRNTVTATYLNRTQPLQDWCDELGLTYTTMWARIYKYGYTPERAFSAPVRAGWRPPHA